ncbi:hypothetical protein DFH06DRAFT_1431808 [Mycena polygramma]|nr:hypothetical protein DFH06DRAFT_1431808 [Mycena polygramma]
MNGSASTDWRGPMSKRRQRNADAFVGTGQRNNGVHNEFKCATHGDLLTVGGVYRGSRFEFTEGEMPSGCAVGAISMCEIYGHSGRTSEEDDATVQILDVRCQASRDCQIAATPRRTRPDEGVQPVDANARPLPEIALSWLRASHRPHWVSCTRLRIISLRVPSTSLLRGRKWYTAVACVSLEVSFLGSQTEEYRAAQNNPDQSAARLLPQSEGGQRVDENAVIVGNSHRRLPEIAACNQEKHGPGHSHNCAPTVSGEEQNTAAGRWQAGIRIVVLGRFTGLISVTSRSEQEVARTKEMEGNGKIARHFDRREYPTRFGPQRADLSRFGCSVALFNDFNVALRSLVKLTWWVAYWRDRRRAFCGATIPERRTRFARAPAGDTLPTPRLPARNRVPSGQSKAVPYLYSSSPVRDVPPTTYLRLLLSFAG